MEPFADEFDGIIEETDRLLCDSYRASVGQSEPTAGPRIRFPRTRNGKLRVSEQEARFVLTARLAGSQLLYSVETPTSLPYQFTGSFGLSGNTDVTVYTPTREVVWNLEFKAHGFSEARLDTSSVDKDIMKLLLEPHPAYWFHTFEGVDRSTLRSTWRVFLSCIREVATRLSAAQKQIVAKTLVFHACVLRSRFSAEQRIPVDPIKWQAGEVPAIPFPEYRVRQDRLVTFEEMYGWKLRRY
jgi:hypothetical protein